MSEDILSGIRERLEAAIDKVGGQRELARRSGLSSNTISLWTLGKAGPSVQNLLALAKGADVSVAWLITGDGEMEDSNNPAAALIELETALETARPEGQLIAVVNQHIARGFRNDEHKRAFSSRVRELAKRASEKLREGNSQGFRQEIWDFDRIALQLDETFAQSARPETPQEVAKSALATIRNFGIENSGAIYDALIALTTRKRPAPEEIGSVDKDGVSFKSGLRMSYDELAQSLRPGWMEAATRRQQPNPGRY